MAVQTGQTCMPGKADIFYIIRCRLEILQNSNFRAIKKPFRLIALKLCPLLLYEWISQTFFSFDVFSESVSVGGFPITVNLVLPFYVHINKV